MTRIYVYFTIIIIIVRCQSFTSKNPDLIRFFKIKPRHPDGIKKSRSGWKKQQWEPCFQINISFPASLFCQAFVPRDTRTHPTCSCLILQFVRYKSRLMERKTKVYRITLCSVLVFFYFKPELFPHRMVDGAPAPLPLGQRMESTAKAAPVEAMGKAGRGPTTSTE